MKIDLEVVRGIIRLKLKNYENTLSTSGVISIYLKSRMEICAEKGYLEVYR